MESMTADTPTAADHRAAGIEKMARAMAAFEGWNSWGEAVDFNDTLSGNEPEDERQHYIALATAALAAWEAHEKQKTPDD